MTPVNAPIIGATYKPKTMIGDPYQVIVFLVASIKRAISSASPPAITQLPKIANVVRNKYKKLDLFTPERILSIFIVYTLLFLNYQAVNFLQTK